MSKIKLCVDDLSSKALNDIEISIKDVETAYDTFKSVSVPNGFTEATLFNSDVALLNDVLHGLKKDKSWISLVDKRFTSFYNDSISDVSNCEVSEITVKDYKINKVD